MKGSISGGVTMPPPVNGQFGGQHGPRNAHGNGPQHGQQTGMWGGMNGMPQGLFGGAPGMQPPNIQLPPMFQSGQTEPIQTAAAPQQFASGGKLTHLRSMKLRNPKLHQPHMHGLFHSSVPGRTDKLHISVPHDSYIVPADVVSGLGEGNTLAGGKALDQLTGGAGPHGTSMGKNHFSSGGMVPIVVAGGEYHIHPDAVKKIGKGNVKHGHQILDAFVKHVRAKTTEKMQNLPGPKK